MRGTTATIDDLLEDDGGQWLVALAITLPLKPGEVVPVSILVAEGEATVGLDTYLPSIKDRGAISFTEGAATDGTSFVLANNEETFGHVISEGDRTLDGATAFLRFIFFTAAGREAREVGQHYLDEIRVDQNTKTVSFNLVTDLSRKNVQIGGEQLSQRCLYVFNVGGLVQIESGVTVGTVGRKCAWALAQGGNPAECDYTLNGPNGCKAHNNAHHIGAVPELEPNAAATAGTLPRPIDETFDGHPDLRDPRLRHRVPYLDEAPVGGFLQL